MVSHAPPGEKYAVLVGNKVVETEPEHGNGLAEAFVHGLKHFDPSKPHSVQEVRQVISEIITESPHKWKDHYRRENMREALISHSKDILNQESWGGIAEVVVAEKIYNIRVKIVGSDGSVVRPSPKGSGTEVTLQYSDRPQAHYDVIVNGTHVTISSEHGNCLYAAIAHEVTRLQDRNLDATAVRSAVSSELLENPERWHDMYQRKQTMEISRFGQRHLMKGAAGQVNESTKLKKNTYKFVSISDKESKISYEQENSLRMETTLTFDKKPEGPTININPPYLQRKGGIDVMRVSNGAKIIKKTIDATGCSYYDNEGRCKYTKPSQGQVGFSGGQRDKSGSAPVSYHVIGSEAGANAGIFFGNSVVTSEHYNKWERYVADCIKGYVGDQKFSCRATVEFEDLVQPFKADEEMMTLRDQYPTPDVKLELVPNFSGLQHMKAKKSQAKKSCQQKNSGLKLMEKEKKLQEKLKQGLNKNPRPTVSVQQAMNKFRKRTGAINKAMREKYNGVLAKTPGGKKTAPITDNVAQRVKSLMYEVKFNGETHILKMPRDTELYLRPDLSNDDLKYMKVLTGPPLAGLGASTVTGGNATYGVFYSPIAGLDLDIHTMTGGSGVATGALDDVSYPPLVGLDHFTLTDDAPTSYPQLAGQELTTQTGPVSAPHGMSRPQLAGQELSTQTGPVSAPNGMSRPQLAGQELSTQTGPVSAPHDMSRPQLAGQELTTQTGPVSAPHGMSRPQLAGQELTGPVSTAPHDMSRPQLAGQELTTQTGPVSAPHGMSRPQLAGQELTTQTGPVSAPHGMSRPQLAGQELTTHTGPVSAPHMSRPQLAGQELSTQTGPVSAPHDMSYPQLAGQELSTQTGPVSAPQDMSYPPHAGLEYAPMTGSITGGWCNWWFRQHISSTDCWSGTLKCSWWCNSWFRRYISSTDCWSGTSWWCNWWFRQHISSTDCRSETLW